jgi:hypothetical protein
VTAVPVHEPEWHASAVVQGFPSLQLVPSIAGAVPVQLPARHWSLRLQGLRSSHEAPSGFLGLLHPVAGSQTPAVWQESRAWQTTGVLPVHTPAMQTSLAVHGLPSLHDVPSGREPLPQMPSALS